MQTLPENTRDPHAKCTAAEQRHARVRSSRMTDTLASPVRIFTNSPSFPAWCHSHQPADSEQSKASKRMRQCQSIVLAHKQGTAAPPAVRSTLLAASQESNFLTSAFTASSRRESDPKGAGPAGSSTWNITAMHSCAAAHMQDSTSIATSQPRKALALSPTSEQLPWNPNPN